MSQPFPSYFPLPSYTVVGELVISWAFVEQKIDLCMGVIFDNLDCSAIQTQLPRGAKRKVRFLKRAFKEIPALAPFAAEIAPLLSLAKALAQTRHTTVHGTLAGYDEQTQEVIFNIVDSEGPEQIIGAQRIVVPEMLRISGQCQDLTAKLHAVAERLAKAVMG